MDRLSPEKRKQNMAAIKGKDTGPEMIVRRLLHAMGYRFRLHRKDLIGKPDIYLPRYKTAVFVHGCFWHGHQGCKRATLPATRPEFWADKIGKNRARDQRVAEALTQAGVRVLTVWQCELKDLPALRARLDGELKNSADHAASRALSDDDDSNNA
jgi:DNA mismatch endonuclease, patch repair protein